MWLLGFLIAEQLGSQSKHPKRMWKLQVIKVYLKNWHCWASGICCLLSGVESWTILPSTSLYRKLPRKIQDSHVIWRRDRARSRSGCLSPTACGFLLEPCAGRLACPHPSWAEAEGNPIPFCRGPAPVESGVSKGRWHRRSGNNSLFKC